MYANFKTSLKLALRDRTNLRLDWTQGVRKATTTRNTEYLLATALTCALLASFPDKCVSASDRAKANEESEVEHEPRLASPAHRFVKFLVDAIASASEEPTPQRRRDSSSPATEWRFYGGSASNDKYSALTQVNRSNVRNLEVAWQFPVNEHGGLQTTPIIIGSTLYAITPQLKVIALDAATGKLRWQFVPRTHAAGPSRGLTYYKDGTRNLLFAGIMSYLYALDADTGKPINSFGENGAVDLRKGLGGRYQDHYVAMTSPGVTYKDLIIVGFRTSETTPAPPGDIRAYDVRSGNERWRFRTIPESGEHGYETWPPDARNTSGAANSWAGFALDELRGIVYVPTGSPTPDFFGGERRGYNLFANSLVALDAANGKRLWHFQFVHHDLWDRDAGSPPTLLTVLNQGRRVDAVAQPTKQGFVFVFDRVTGKTLFPIEERAVPPSTVPGELAAKTQPFPIAPEPFARQRLTESMLADRTPDVRAWTLNQFRSFRSEGQFVPLSLGKQTVVFPGFDGGAEWGGAAADPSTGTLYINSNDVPWIGGLVKTAAVADIGSAIYQEQCAGCHGANRRGSPPQFPALRNIYERWSEPQIAALIRRGGGRMPPFAQMPEPALTAVASYLYNADRPRATAASAAGGPLVHVSNKPHDPNTKVETASPQSSNVRLPKYQFTGYNKFIAPDGYPAVEPPWGTLNAIDLNTGRYRWRIPLGEYPQLSKQGIKNTGSENYGGPIATAGGLVFIGATVYDRKLRAFDSSTGALLWETELPFAGTATPATYMSNGKQYVVIATSSSRDPSAKQGAAYVAFALP